MSVPGCSRIYAWSEALATHVGLAHLIIHRSRLDNSKGLQTLPASNASISQDDTRAPVQRRVSKSDRGLSQWNDTQVGSTGPVYSSVRSSHQAAPVGDADPRNTSTHSPIILSDGEDGEGNVGGLLPMLPDHWTGTQTGSEVPVPSSIATPHEADPMDDSNRYSADVLSLMSSDDDEDDSEGDVSGLPCPHSSCYGPTASRVHQARGLTCGPRWRKK